MVAATIKARRHRRSFTKASATAMTALPNAHPHHPGKVVADRSADVARCLAGRQRATEGCRVIGGFYLTIPAEVASSVPDRRGVRNG